MKHHLRFRQIHLDFHTSPKIPGIGAKFDRKEWQRTLKEGHVDSVTTFSKCHHGWSYHPTKVGKMHPHLKFDLLRAQYEASKEIGVNVPLYISAGVDNVCSYEHPEWREVGFDGTYTGWARRVVDAGFHKMCFNSPYLDYLCAQIREAVSLFPEADGVFLDIIYQGQCCCRWCLDLMEEHGWDATLEADRQKCAKLGLERYYRETTEAVRCDNKDYPVFHNSGHITVGNRAVLKYFSHLELESLPTGGWGYDHFPMSAKYCQNLGLDFLGMTGKFHTTWGEFGGFKHPNALRYECAAMLAHGSKCSVGDQLHPSGKLDESTYRLIGAAYKEVEEKEKWCDNATSVVDVAILSSASTCDGHGREASSDTGAARMLLENQILFDFIDSSEANLARYKAIILPDDVCVGPELEKKLRKYLAGGGRLMLTWKSGLKTDGSGFLFDIGGKCLGENGFQPDFVLPEKNLRPSFVDSPLVMYVKSMKVKRTNGRSLGQVYNPYFNRDFRHFCSHQHTPPELKPSGFDAGILNGSILYLAHPVFSIYRGFGAVAYKEYAMNALKMLLGAENMTLLTNLPSTARATLMEQKREKRWILHLLYAGTVNRGGEMHLPGGTSGPMRSVEVIEDLLPLHNVEVTVTLPRKIRKVTLEPQGREIPFEADSFGRISLKIDSFTCHQMVVIT